MKKSTHQLAVVAQDGLPQRVVQQDLVWEVHELADAAVQGASGAGLAGLAAPWSAKRGEAAAAGAQARPRPAGLGFGSALPRKAPLGSAVQEDGTPRHALTVRLAASHALLGAGSAVDQGSGPSLQTG